MARLVRPVLAGQMAQIDADYRPCPECPRGARTEGGRATDQPIADHPAPPRPSEGTRDQPGDRGSRVSAARACSLNRLAGTGAAPLQSSFGQRSAPRTGTSVMSPRPQPAYIAIAATSPVMNVVGSCATSGQRPNSGLRKRPARRRERVRALLGDAQHPVGVSSATQIVPSTSAKSGRGDGPSHGSTAVPGRQLREQKVTDAHLIHHHHLPLAMLELPCLRADS